MKLLCITLFFSLLLLFASRSTESRKEPKDSPFKNVFEDDIHAHSNSLLSKPEIPFIKDIEPQPDSNKRIPYNYISKDSSSHHSKGLSFIKDIEPQPNSNKIFLMYRSKDSSSHHSKGLSFIKDIEPQPNSNKILWIYRSKDSSSHPQPDINNYNPWNYVSDPNTSQGPSSPSDMVFFTISDLKLGKKIPLYIPQNDPSTTPPSLSKEIADSIPFSLEQLPRILNFFSFPRGSPQAQVVESALLDCEREPSTGETKYCGTSMESMAEFTSSALGSSVKHLASTLVTKSKSHPSLQNYTLLQMPNEIRVSEYFACHTLQYPYAVHYCHSRFGVTKLLHLPMEGENGDRVEILAVCHMDTADWMPTHPSFRVLKAKPGTIPVCHLLPLGDLLWIPTSASAST